MTLEIIITTMNDNIINVIDDFFPSEKDVIFLISHQITKHKTNIFQDEVEKFLNKRPDVQYIYFFEKGLSLNRNRSMKVSIGDICMVTDDDIVFKPNAYKEIMKSFEELPDADIITFKAEFPDGKQYKKYKNTISKHTKRSCMRVSSFEIAYKRKSIDKANLRWDENFGLGGNPYTNHMENIFMVDSIDKGLKGFLYPKTLIVHPFINSGFNYSEHMVFSKGAAFQRMFGNLGYLLNMLYALKKFRDYSSQMTLTKFCFLSAKGSNHFRKQKKAGLLI